MADTQRPDDADADRLGYGNGSGSAASHHRADDDAADRSGDPEARPWRLKSDTDEQNKKSGKSGSFLREVAIIVVCVLFLTWVLQMFIGRQYVIPSESMEPTLLGGNVSSNDRIVIDKLVYRFSDPEAGDVVVFKGPTDSWNDGWMSPRSTNTVMKGVQDGLSWFGFAPPDENNLVKRIIATGGQTVECRNADGVGVKVDGKVLNEPYVDKKLQAETVSMTPDAAGPAGVVPPCYGADFGPIKVPDGNVWVMGDNRLNSADSRFHMEDEYHGTVPVSDIRGKVRIIIYPFSRLGGVGAVNPQK